MLIDISQKLNKNTFIYDGDPKFSINEVCNIEKDGYTVHSISFGSHFGTHIDFPKHFFENGKTADFFPPEKMSGKTIVLSVLENDILNKNFFSSKHIEENDIVALKFNCKPFGITEDGAKYLTTIGIKMIVTEGIDIEDYEDFRVHKILLAKEILILECANLSSVPCGICRLYAFALNIEFCDASPVRAVIEI